jgi:hypothetical protein
MRRDRREDFDVVPVWQPVNPAWVGILILLACAGLIALAAWLGR